MAGLQAAAESLGLTKRLSAQVDAQTLDETVKDTLQCYIAAPEQYPEASDADMYKGLPLHTVQGVGLFPAYTPQLPAQDVVMPQQEQLSASLWYSTPAYSGHIQQPQAADASQHVQAKTAADPTQAAAAASKAGTVSSMCTTTHCSTLSCHTGSQHCCSCCCCGLIAPQTVTHRLLLTQSTYLPYSSSRLTCIGCSAAVPKRAKRQPKGKARPGKMAGKDAKAPAKPPPARWAESEILPLIPVMKGA